MQDVVTLALPFFGLILLGFGAGKLRNLPEAGLSWMNFFVVYLALPALFFRLLSETPFEQLANVSFVAATTFTTYIVFAISFCIGVLATRGNIGESTILGIAGAYSNVGYMGPGLTLAVLGEQATVPTALILAFDNALMFILAPLLMALAGTENDSFLGTLKQIGTRIFTHPFILATIAGVMAAAFEFRPPQAVDTLLRYLSNAAAPCALFAMGVSIALRPVGRIPLELPVVLAIKLVLHPVLIFLLLSFLGGFDPSWVATAVLMSCLPPATNVFVIAQQYGTYVQRASSFVLIGTAISIVTVTFFIWAITTGLLPT
ncbi:AEC family transporter [Roseibium porphyridii]|uniref:AEC family transporter n=1 Tax=Roseibium porphyridii TaxID=2866279 RepID=A0ABY8F132_9HYPH|nr:MULTISPECIES: AEC family transporter [Stappiaceae]QFT32162.1 Membrane transport protein [Labrenzia sp. THAF82]WFE87540.1 AEC family transporter [Roseibium sp. KMA01]